MKDVCHTFGINCSRDRKDDSTRAKLRLPESLDILAPDAIQRFRFAEWMTPQGRSKCSKHNHFIGQPLGVIEPAVERDTFMSPDEAKEFGLIDEIVASRPSSEDEDEGKQADKAEKDGPG